jgi:hypothetical protein
VHAAALYLCTLASSHLLDHDWVIEHQRVAVEKDSLGEGQLMRRPVAVRKIAITERDYAALMRWNHDLTEITNGYELRLEIMRFLAHFIGGNLIGLNEVDFPSKHISILQWPQDPSRLA